MGRDRRRGCSKVHRRCLFPGVFTPVPSMTVSFNAAGERTPIEKVGTVRSRVVRESIQDEVKPEKDNPARKRTPNFYSEQ